MEEIFELIKAFNRLKESVVEMISKIDLLLKLTAPADIDAINRVSTDDYVDEDGACRILHISPRKLAYLRADKSIPFIKKGKRVQYLVSDLNAYLDRIKIRSKF
jgi:hypothetical protein